jgi:hypothetical protein
MNGKTFERVLWDVGRCELREGRKGEAEDALVGMPTTERPEPPVWLSGGEDVFFA